MPRGRKPASQPLASCLQLEQQAVQQLHLAAEAQQRWQGAGCHQLLAKLGVQPAAGRRGAGGVVEECGMKISLAQ
jgi:hypothetical protein